MDEKQPLYLRVRENSEIDKIIRAMSNGEKLTEDEVVAVTGLRSSPSTLRWLATRMDNVSARTTKRADGKVMSLRFVDVTPSSAAHVTVSASIAQADGAVAAGGVVEQKPHELIRWPSAPSILNKKDFFREPEWFKTMRTMVAAGRHISLESPPSVGKDTAVEQLAAEEGIPLVTVSGDGGLRARALIGSMSMSNGSTTFQVAEFAAAVVNGWWALITEVNAAEADVLLILNSLMAAPYAIQINGISYKVHPDFRLFVTYNAGLVGTKPLPQSTKDRFFPIKLSFFNRTQLRSRLEAHGLPSLGPDDNWWSERVVDYGTAMWAAYEAGRMRYQVSVRRLIDAIALVKFGSDVKAALEAAVVAAIDSPVESKVARHILREVCDGIR